MSVVDGCIDRCLISVVDGCIDRCLMSEIDGCIDRCLMSVVAGPEQRDDPETGCREPRANPG